MGVLAARLSLSIAKKGNMSDEVKYLHTVCMVCNGEIDFPAQRLDEKIACPHCAAPIALKASYSFCTDEKYQRPTPKPTRSPSPRKNPISTGIPNLIRFSDALESRINAIPSLIAKNWKISIAMALVLAICTTALYIYNDFKAEQAKRDAAIAEKQKADEISEMYRRQGQQAADRKKALDAYWDEQAKESQAKMDALQAAAFKTDPVADQLSRANDIAEENQRREFIRNENAWYDHQQKQRAADAAAMELRRIADAQEQQVKNQR